MFDLLVRTQLLSLFSSLTGKNRAAKNGKKQSAWMPVLAVILFLYLIGVFVFMTFGLSISLCRPLIANGIGWLYFALPFAISLLLSVFLGIFSTQNQLFNAKDNELLLSMPIKPGAILASRIFMLLVPDYFFEFILVAISGGVYVYYFGITVPGLLILLLIALAVPLLAMSVSAFIGWLIAALTARIKHKQLFTTIISLLFLILYFTGYSWIMSNLTPKEGEAAVDITAMLIPAAESLGRYFPPLKWMGAAIAEHNVIYTLLSLAVTVIPFAVVITLLTKSFTKIVTSKRGAAKKKYTGKPMKVSSQRKALYLRDLKRLGGCAVYLTNSCTGGLMMIILSVIFTLQGNLRGLRSGMLAESPELVGIIAPAAALLLCMISSMISVTASSVSLEGKYIWIVKTLPAKTFDILMSKVLVHLTIALPSSFISSLILCFTVKPSLIEILPYFLLPLVFNVFCAMFGLISNLRFPKLDWINEVQPVKQSAACTVAMFAPMGILMVVGAVFIVPAAIIQITGIFAYALPIAMLLLSAALAALSLIEYRALRGWGVRRFDSL